MDIYKKWLTWPFIRVVTLYAISTFLLIHGAVNLLSIAPNETTAITAFGVCLGGFWFATVECMRLPKRADK